MPDFHDPKKVSEWRYWATRRSPYYSRYIYRFKYKATPGSRSVAIRRDWTVEYDPELTVGEMWRSLTWLSHGLAMGYIDRCGDRDKQEWSTAANLAIFEAWRNVMEREDTLATYPPRVENAQDSYPPGTVRPEDIGLPRGLTAEGYYKLIHEEGQAGGGGSTQSQQGTTRIAEQSVPASPQPGELEQAGTEEIPGAGSPSGGQTPPESGDSPTAPGEADGANAPGTPGAGGQSQQPAQGKSQQGGDPGASQGQGQPAGGNPHHAPGGEEPRTKPQGGGAGNGPSPLPLDLANSETPQDPDMPNMQQDAKNEAQKFADSHGGLDAGTLPGDLTEALRPAPVSKVPIERMLAKMVGTVKSQLDYSYAGRASARSLNHPDGVVMPKLNTGMPSVTCVVDTSGSMSDAKVAEAIGHCVRAAKATSVHVVMADTELKETTKRFVTAQDIKKLRERKGYGGTDMVGAIKEARRKYKDEAIFCVTDGIFNWNGAEKLRQTIWVVITDDRTRHGAERIPKGLRNVHVVEGREL
ncbi:MAG: VWA-like domain-containing protein [Candidatus Dormibacteria bacterium]